MDSINRWPLVTLQLIIGISAIFGGIGLVIDPSGANLNFLIEWLEKSPFSNYFIPGILLIVVIGLGNIFGGILSILKYSYAARVSMALGIFLVLWIGIQVWWLGLSTWLQPLYLILGGLEIFLGKKGTK